MAINKFYTTLLLSLTGLCFLCALLSNGVERAVYNIGGAILLMGYIFGTAIFESMPKKVDKP